MKTFHIQSAVLNSVSSLWTQLRAAVLVPLSDMEMEMRALQGDAEFERRLLGDPCPWRIRNYAAMGV